MTEINNKFDEVNKKLGEFREEIRTKHYDYHYDIQLEATREICELFPQPLDDEGLKERIDSNVLAGLHRVIPALGGECGVIDAYLTSAEINAMRAKLLALL